MKAVDVLTRHDCFWIGEHYGSHVGPRVSELAREALDQGLGRQALAGMLRQELGKVGPNGYTYWDVVASSALVRARSFGSISGMSDAGITEYEILAMDDERMCPICGEMDGRTFSVAAAQGVIDAAIGLTSPDAFKAAMPWHSTSPKMKSSAELMASGQALPPFHGRCRCTMVMAEPKAETPAEPPMPETLPKPVVVEPQPKPKPIEPQPKPKPTPRPAQQPKPTKPTKPTPRPRLDDEAALRARVDALRTKNADLARRYDDIDAQMQAAAQAGDSKRYRELTSQLADARRVLTENEKELKRSKVEAAEKGIIYATELEKKLDKADVDAIIERVKAAPADVRKVWNLYEDQMKVEDKAAKSGGGACYNPGSRSIKINIERDRSGIWGGDALPPYRAIFHELGHLVDASATRHTGAYSRGGHYDLLGVAKKEAGEHVKATLDRLKANAMRNGKDPKAIGKADAYAAVSRDLSKLGVRSSALISDFFSGATGNKAKGHWSHSAGYWKSNPQLLCNEFFAEMFSSSIVDPQAIEIARRYAPQSCGLFERMLKDIVDKEVRP